ncbi:MAG: BrnA antitoxin family protein [Neisseriaceae bacterium]|nr:BrnA antitoxin family protein [Neisseriaceae bacterium]MBR3425242.1 BrnA antitoxin family protein [Neisseriaceae bacterium]
MAIVRYREEDIPELTQADIDAIKNIPDEEIDFSDIPPLTEQFWQNAVRGQFYRPKKSQVSVRIDNDILAWLKKDGKGYQTRLNQILRQAMNQSLNVAP